MNSKKINILLVEDDLNDAEFIKDTLLKFISPESFFHVEDGAQALDFIFKEGKYENIKEDTKPGLILLDLKTPKINGLEVLQKIKSDSATKSIPVVIVTSSKEEKDLIDSYKYGANSFIVKPIDYEMFEKTISHLGEYWLNTNQF